MTIASAKDIVAFLTQQLRDGVCSDAGKFVNKALPSVRRQRSNPFEVTPELESWLTGAADQPALAKADFERIRKRLRNRSRSPRG